MIDKVVIDHNDGDELSYHIEHVLVPAIDGYFNITEELAKLDIQIQNSDVGNEVLFNYIDNRHKLTDFRNILSTFWSAIELCPYEIIEEVDEPFFREMEVLLTKTSRISIDNYEVDGSGIVIQKEDYKAGVVSSAPQTKVISEKTKNKITFTDLMNSKLTRKIKQNEYTAFLEMNMLGETDLTYDKFIMAMYRNSEFSYTSEASQLKKVVTTGMVIIAVGGVVLSLGTGIAAFAAISKYASAGLTLVDFYQWVTGVDENGIELSSEEKRKLRNKIGIDVGLFAISWGLTKYYKHVQLKGTSGIESNTPIWDSWDNYEKITVDGKVYAKVGDKLYSKHAVDRMQPSGSRFGPNIHQAGGDYGRSVAPNYVEDVLNTAAPVFQPETGNYVYSSGSIKVITNPEGAIVTIMTYR